MSSDARSGREYCRTRAAPTGSSLYYSLLYQDPAHRPLLHTLHAFHNALADVISECSDPGVAHMKLAWWQEELQRLVDQQPRHPITQAMSALPEGSAPPRLLMRLVEHYDAHINLQQPNDYGTLIHFLQDGPGQFWQHLALVTGSRHPDTPDIARELGARFAYFRVLQEQPLHLAHQRLYYPRNEEHNQDAALMYSRQLERLESEFAQLSRQVPKVDRKNQRHLITLAHILRVTARETRLAGCDLRNQHVSLTPVRKLWIAWRSRFLVY